MSREIAQGSPERPLDGIRILDLSRAFSGPYCTMMLADLGAEVVKIENPVGGDETRQWTPMVQDQSGYFFALNRSKRSVAINLRTQAGQEIVHRLAAWADVAVENFTPGVAARLGADYDTLRAINPRLIYCSISGFGQQGPYRLRKAYDPVAQALGGVMGLTGQPDGPPAKVGIPVGDIAPAMFAAIAVIAALLWRERSGRGQYIDVAMLDCQVSWLSVQAAIYLHTGQVPRRMGSEHPGRMPTAAFLTADGRYLHVVCNDAQWPRLCEVLGLDDLGKNPRYAKNRQRSELRHELMPRLQSTLLQRSAAEWERLLVEAGIPCAPVNDVAEVFADPQVVAREIVQIFEFPGIGPVPGIRLPIRYDELETGIKARPPRLGEHTRTVLTELGYGGAEIDAMLRAGIIAAP